MTARFSATWPRRIPKGIECILLQQPESVLDGSRSSTIESDYLKYLVLLEEALTFLQLQTTGLCVLRARTPLDVLSQQIGRRLAVR
jgi:hypothetical protein